MRRPSGKPVTVTISDVTVEAFQNDGDNVRKAVLHFHGNAIKPLVINKTNYFDAMPDAAGSSSRRRTPSSTRTRWDGLEGS